jgi:hypothetical protein
MTRDPAEFQEIELVYQKTLAELDEARRVFASQRTFENLVTVREVWSRKWDLKIIKMLARNYPDVALETVMDMVFKGDVCGELADPKEPVLTRRSLDEIGDVRRASERMVDAQLAKAKRSAYEKRAYREGRLS